MNALQEFWNWFSTPGWMTVVGVIFMAFYLLVYGRWELNWWREVIAKRWPSKEEASRVSVAELFPEDTKD